MTSFAFVDFETFSEADLKKVGSDNYARHDSTEVLMLALAFDDGKVGLWQPELRPEIPAALLKAAKDPSVKFVAHNAPFERAIFLHVLGIDIPPERWVCTMAMAYSLSLPGSLGQLCKDALRLSGEFLKIEEGKRYINLFCKPRPKKQVTKAKPWVKNSRDTHPEEWEDFCGYCIRDVVAERKVFRILRKFFHDFDALFQLWAYDRRINETGLPLDVELIQGAMVLAKTAAEKFREQMIEISGLANPNSPQQVLKWLRERGYPFESINKARVAIAMKDFAPQITQEAKNFIKLRLAATKTSVKKFDAMLRSVGADGRLRNTFQFCGAGRTGRWAGRVAQLQNLPRPIKVVEPHLDFVRQLIRDRDYETLELLFGNVLNVLVSSIRSAIIAPEGQILNVCDLSAIELCVLAWISGSEFWLEVLAKKRDPYKAFGEHYLEKPYDQITKAERNECKPAALGCGYRLGGGDLVGDYPDQKKTGLWAYAESMGVAMDRKSAHRAVSVYRGLSPEVVNLWYDLEGAFLNCVKDGKPRKVGMFQFDIRAPFLRIRLPSGRYLFYCRPMVKNRVIVKDVSDEDGNPVYEEVVIDGAKVKRRRTEKYHKQEISYEGVHQTTKKWVRMDTHGGKLVENIVQAIARDILVEGMLESRNVGFNIIGHVHDELISLDDGDDRKRSVEALRACMSKAPAWASGLPLDAAGFSTKFYKKD